MQFKLLVGDALDRIKDIPDKSINCCITSPPYFNLRDYGTTTWVGGLKDCDHSSIIYSRPNLRPRKQTTDAGSLIYKTLDFCPTCGAVKLDKQIGQEKNPDEYINKLLKVFLEVKRVLRDDGIFWLNIGDSYSRKRYDDCKPKDLIGIPWLLAFALRKNGFYLRQDIIWSKTDTMPESVKDRCTRSHEYIFMLTKNKKYWFDHEAMQEEAVGKTRGRRVFGATKPQGTNRHDTGNVYKGDNGKRNKRDVWLCSTSNVKKAHFATYPKKLIEPCIMAGCPENGWVLDPFNGSGTSGIVAVNNGRNYIGIELNPKYIDITKSRIYDECTDIPNIDLKQKRYVKIGRKIMINLK